MIVKEWYALELPITWCIYKDEPEVKYPQIFEVGKSYRLSEMVCRFCGTKGEDCDCHENLTLNLDAPVSDGIYRVKMNSRHTDIWESGVTVKDGVFVPKPTAEAIYRLVVRHHYKNPTFTEPIDHSFLEMINWNGNTFKVLLGS